MKGVVVYAAERLAAWASELQIGDVPGEVVEAAKLHILDAVGAGLAALALNELPAVRATAAEMHGPPEATALGLAERVSAGAAALSNGSMMHALDFDDTHEVALVHSSVVVASAALSVGEAVEASGAELLVAAIAGYEISSRIGLAQPGALHLRGFHPTSVCGVFAAAVIASRLRCLSREQTQNALGIAGSQASGLMEFLSDGSQTKPLHAGWASFAGILATSLASHGATGPASVLEGRFGLLASHVGRFDASMLTANLGSRWETTQIAFKPYPSCHCTHAVLDAMIETGLRAEEIEEIVALVPSEVAVGLVLEPWERKARPSSAYDAKFSIPFCIGALLTQGEVSVDAFTPEAIIDEHVLEIARRVSYEIVPFEDGNDLSGGVRVRANGQTMERRVLRPRGGPANPMSVAELHAKFRRNAALALKTDDVEQALEVLTDLERRTSSEVAALFAKAKTTPTVF
jgi:2-methylcitrate dehydratase PrpD